MERTPVIVALALSPSLDVTYEVDELVSGAITRPTHVTRVAGGKALNVARVARALGADVRAVAALGGHPGAWVQELLVADGVAVDPVRIRRDTRTCTAVVERRGGTSSTDVYETATPLDEDEWDAFRATAAEAARDAGWVALSGSMPTGVEGDAAAALLRDLRRSGARIAVDSSGHGLDALAATADLIKVNRAEADELFAARHPDAASAAGAAHARYGCDVVVTDGVRGGAALLGRTAHTLPTPRRIGRFSAGSGDAFLGGLLAALDGGEPAGTALATGVRCAERNALVAGQGVLG